jgi:predicted transcriptional regulator
MSTTQGIKLDESTQARLKALAEKRKRSPHWLMRTAIEDYLKHEERYEAEKAEDMARWEHYLITGNTIDGDKMEELLQELAEGKTVKWPK